MSTLQCHAVAACVSRMGADKPFLTRLGLSEQDFEAMVWLSSWAVLPDTGTGAAHTGVQHQEGSQQQGQELDWAVGGLSAAEKRGVGRQCKDIIDAGRVVWLRDMGMVCELVEYIDSSVCPENRLIVAS